MGFKRALISLFKTESEEAAPANKLASKGKQPLESQPKRTEANDALAKEISAWMRKEKPYLQQGYSREACAAALNMPEHKLSSILNQCHQKNFNEFVNGFRVEEAKARLVDEPKTTAKIIAFETGFSSIASFNRVFKEMTGRSPTEYRKAR